MLVEMVLDVSRNFVSAFRPLDPILLSFAPTGFRRFQPNGKEIIGLHDAYKKFAIKIICFMIG